MTREILKVWMITFLGGQCSMIFRSNPDYLYIHMYESKNTKILSSILIITLSFIVFND
eukprot:UN05459